MLPFLALCYNQSQKGCVFVTNATYKLLKRLSKINGATCETMYSWGYFEKQEDFDTRLSILDMQNQIGRLNDEDPLFYLLGPGEESLRQERFLRQTHFLAWGTFIIAIASLLTSICSVLLSL